MSRPLLRAVLVLVEVDSDLPDGWSDDTVLETVTEVLGGALAGVTAKMEVLRLQHVGVS